MFDYYWKFVSIDPSKGQMECCVFRLWQVHGKKIDLSSLIKQLEHILATFKIEYDDNGINLYTDIITCKSLMVYQMKMINLCECYDHDNDLYYEISQELSDDYDNFINNKS